MHQSEQLFYCKNICLGFAKIWAYKEAIIKAAGGSVGFLDIEIIHKENGAPYVRLMEKEALLSYDVQRLRVHVTLTDELPYVFAVCVIECL
jgi:phosphopantetheine--protein transferase-like protein